MYELVILELFSALYRLIPSCMFIHLCPFIPICITKSLIKQMEYAINQIKPRKDYQSKNSLELDDDNEPGGLFPSIFLLSYIKFEIYLK